MPTPLRQLLDKRVEKKWDTFSWTTLRALVSSLNHVINVGAPRLVGDIRAAWLGSAAEPRIIERPDDTSFLVLGDPGEQDASQFVVVPALVDEVNAKGGPSFMVVCSDVIYPSGDVNDYVDGFYVPYDEIRELPIYALPGNHDWYDGLAGFMWHFCGAKPLPTTVYGGPDRRSGVVEWVSRLLWRRPSKPRKQLGLEERRKRQFPGGPLQSTPYFAIDTKHVRVVCIDTGVTGEVDATQARWLLRVSADPRPKVLLTGKPLLVNRARKPGKLEAAVTNGAGDSFGTVDEIVRHAGHGYVAAIGGDIHNLQHYDAGTPEHPFHYVVAGGGGAFMAATHQLAIVPEDDAPVPVKLYPNEVHSLRHFSRSVLPKVWRFVRVLLFVLLGLGGAGLWIWLSDDASAYRDALQWTALGFGGWALLRSLFPDPWKTTKVFRFFVALAATALGFVLGLAGWWLAPERFGQDLAGWAGITLAVAVIAAVLRATSWWRPRTARLSVPRPWLALIIAVLVATTVVAWLVDPVLGLAAFVTTVVTIYSGWVLRKRSWWSPGIAFALATVMQLVDLLVVLERTVVPDGAHTAFWAAIVAVPAGLLFIALLAFVVLPALAYVVAAAWPGSTRAAWGRVGEPAQLFLPVLTVGAVCGLCLGLHEWVSPATWRAAMTAGLVLPLAIGVVFLIDWVRRHSRWGFSEIDALGIGVALFVLAREDAIVSTTQWVLVSLAAASTFGGFGLLRPRMRADSYKQDLVVLGSAAIGLLWTFGAHDTWLLRAAVAGAIVPPLILLGFAIGQLVFLGAHSMIFDLQTHRDGEQLTVDQAKQIIDWRLYGPKHRPGPPVRWRANVAFPGESRPHGIVQQKASEIFDTDKTPFAKNFLVVESTAEQLTIRARLVTGEEPEPKPYSFTIPL